MLKFSENWEFSNENSWILKEVWPNSDPKSSNGSIPRRPNLSTKVHPGDRVVLRFSEAVVGAAGAVSLVECGVDATLRDQTTGLGMGYINQT